MANIWILLDFYYKVGKVTKEINNGVESKYEITFISPLSSVKKGCISFEDKLIITEVAIKRRFTSGREAYLYHNTNSDVYS